LAIDVDRFLLNTDLFHDLYLKISYDVASIDPSEVNKIRLETETISEDGIKKSFHTDTALLELLEARDLTRGKDIYGTTPDQFMNEIHEQMVKLCNDEQVRKSLYLPGAKEFIDRLRREGVFERREAYLFTHGTEVLQLTKIAGLGLNDVLSVITDKPNKGEQLLNLRGDDGLYRIPTRQGFIICTTEIGMGDDRGYNFRKFPSATEGARGYLKIAKGSEIEPWIHDTDNIEVVDSFDNLLRYMGITALKTNIDKV